MNLGVNSLTHIIRKERKEIQKRLKIFFFLTMKKGEQDTWCFVGFNKRMHSFLLSHVLSCLSIRSSETVCIVI